MRNPNIPVTFQLLTATARLKTLLTHGPRDKSVNPAPGLLVNGESPRIREIRDAYIAEVAAGLAKRTGEQSDDNCLHDPDVCISRFANHQCRKGDARQVLIQQFDSLHPIHSGPSSASALGHDARCGTDSFT